MDRIGNEWKLGYYMFKYQKPPAVSTRLNQPTQLPKENEQNQTSSSNSSLTFVSALPHHHQCLCNSTSHDNNSTGDSEILVFSGTSHSLTGGDESEGMSVNTFDSSSDDSWSPKVPEISEITYNSGNDPHYCPTQIDLTIEFSVYNTIPITSTKINKTNKSTGGSQMDTDDDSAKNEDLNEPRWKLQKRDAKGRFRRNPKLKI